MFDDIHSIFLSSEVLIYDIDSSFSCLYFNVIHDLYHILKYEHLIESINDKLEDLEEEICKIKRCHENF
jgi:hypothetical protein